MAKLKTGFDKVPAKKFIKTKKELVVERVNDDNSDDLYIQVEEELSTLGIVPFNGDNVDEDLLILPPLLTSCESRELGDYFSMFTQQKMYVRTLQNRVRALLREANFSLDSHREVVYSSLNYRMPSKEKEVALMSVPAAKELVRSVNYLSTKLDVLDSYLLNLEDAIVLISREITRRSNDFDHDRRSR